MDDAEKRELFRTLCQRPIPETASSSASSSSSSSSHSIVPVSPATNSIPKPHSAPIPIAETSPRASSDASTIEPPTPPPSPPRTLIPPLSQPTTRSPSSSSDASTLPPPTPPPAPTSVPLATSPRAEIVHVDARGIEGWDEDEAARDSLLAKRRQALAGDYPKLSTSHFRFVDANHAELQDLHLSDVCSTGNPPRASSAGILPAAISAHLSPYQRDGVTFLYRLFERGRGGLLADSMGLGKTVQAIVFLGVAFGIWDRDQRVSDSMIEEKPPRILVVAPTSVRENWRSEFQRWTPFKVTLYEKADEARISRAFRTGDMDVLITGDNPLGNYGKTFFSHVVGPKQDWKWDIVIMDEIHVAKNKNTRIYLSLNALPKRVMFGLTGTAVQNRLGELWNVMSLVVPPSLWPNWGSFRKDFIEIINKGTKKDASVYMRKRATERIKLLRKLLAKHMVRRPKSVIEAQLPGKTDYCVLMRMKKSGLQGYMYQRFQESYDVKLLRDANFPCDCGSEEPSKECCHRYPTTKENLANAPIWKMHHRETGPCEKCPNCICLYLQHISRSIAAHALLLLPEENEPDPEKAKCRRELFNYYLGKYRSMVESKPQVLIEQQEDVSCKLNVAYKLLLAFWAQRHKTIIFYESLRLGSMLQRWATNAKLVFEVIDGSVNKGGRQVAVDRFNENKACSIFFISKKAGATGLNICGADRVLIFEPCWNPTLDLQAGDRAYRLGQQRVVQIIRLVVENTIEHYVFKTAITKSQVSSAILDNTKEEWRIREDEVGSMHAMFSMGNVFSSRDDKPDNFHLFSSDKWLNGRPKLGNSEEDPNGSMNESEKDGNTSSQASGLEDVDGAMGDEVMFSLNVDVDNSLWSPSDEEMVADENDEACENTQRDTDMVLEKGGAAGKLVISSTHLRERRRQLLGLQQVHNSSGINPEGARGVNFDDANWSNGRVSMEAEFAELADDEDVVSSRPTSRRRRVTNYAESEIEPNVENVAKVRSVPNRRVTRASTSSKSSAAATKRSSIPPKTQSAFSARARVRR